MKKNFRMLLFAMLLAPLCTNVALAQDLMPTTTPAVDISTPAAAALSSPIVEVSHQSAPVLIAPVVAQPKRLLKPANRKVDLHAIIFDPTVTMKEPANADEMTKTEIAKYKIHEALTGEVSATSTKGLLEDTMKMTFEKGPIESLAPWIDYSGAFSQAWTGPTYTNDTYGINFNDVGVNGKFRTKDDPASGKKTVFRLMYNVGKEVQSNTYMQTFMADNYIMRYWSKEDQVMLGYARAAVGIEGGESPFTIPFFGRSQISRTYGNIRTLGAKAQGSHKLYDYSAGVFSSGRYFKDFFPGPEFTGLVSIKPLGLTDGRYGKLTMGGSLNAGNAESHYCVTGAHLIYDYKRFKAAFEYATADGSNGSTGFSSNSSDGYYGTLSYRVTPKIQALIRYDKFDPNKDKGNDMRTEYTAGVNYFIKGQALKLMFNLVYYTLENGTYGTRIMTGTQFIL